MHELIITVRGRVAEISGEPEIVCGNSDYTVAFVFDMEWSAFTDKTLQLAYCRNGTFYHEDVEFSGNTVTIPALYSISEVFIGVYAGSIRTTTPARVACLPCITDLAGSGGGTPEPPAPDIYAQILARLTALEAKIGALSFVKLTAAEYAALETKNANTVYFVTGTADFTIYLGELPLSGGGSGASFTPVMQLAWAMPSVRAAKLANLNFSPSGSWRCDPEWYYEGARDASIGGRGYAKQSSKPAIGFVAQIDAAGSIYSTLLLISDDATAVGNGWATAASTSVQYGGITWYITRTDYAQGGAYDDALGHFATFPQNLAYDGTTGTISQQAILDVLAAVHATKNEEG